MLIAKLINELAKMFHEWTLGLVEFVLKFINTKAKMLIICATHNVQLPHNW